MTATWHLLYLLSCRDLLVKTRRLSILLTTIQGLQVLHCRPWMLGSEIENPNGDVWLQYHGNVWFCCGNDFFFRAMFGRFTITSWLHRALNAAQMGQYFFGFPAAWPFHVAQQMRGHNDKKLPIQDGRGLFEGILCRTSGFKATCTHQNQRSCSLELSLVFGKKLNKEWPWTDRVKVYFVRMADEETAWHGTDPSEERTAAASSKGQSDHKDH